MQKRILFSHGDKGGTGKSMLSAILVDSLLSNSSLNDIAILEGDASQPDVIERFVETGIQIGAVNLNRAGDAESSIMKFGDWVERSGADQIVVNLPAGAGDTLDELAPVLGEVLSGLKYRSIGLYSLGPTNSSTDSLKRSLESGLMSAVDIKVAVYPEFLGEPVRFDAKKHEQSLLLDEAISIPALRPDLLRDRVLSLRGPFSDMRDSPDLTLVERAMLGRWLDRVHENLVDLFRLEDSPAENIEAETANE
ncbi:MAG: hypothetical protein ACPW60_10210 [Methylohalobius sp. ZOD2]